jgi:hypothetical protein
VSTELNDLLSTPPSDLPDLESRLARPPASVRSRRVTRVLATLLVAALAFTGGVWLADRTGGATAAGGLPAAGQLPDGFPSGGPGQRPGSAEDAATGTVPEGQGEVAASGEVLLVDGTVLYVRTADGQVRVETGEDTALIATGTGVTAGDAVVVRGTTAADGTVTATAVSVTRVTSTDSSAPAPTPSAS